MDMKDFDELMKDYESKLLSFRMSCEDLYKAIKDKCSPLVISLYVNECNKCELAMQSARRDMYECYEREATIATLED